MSRGWRKSSVLIACGLVFAAPRAGAIPQRSLVARPLPPAAFAAEMSADSSVVRLTQQSAQALADTLLAHVSAARGLQPLRPVPASAQSRTAMRRRLEEIVRADAIDDRLRQEERLLVHLGLLPASVNLTQLFHRLLEEQLAGFYDIDRRELVLADWLQPELQAGIASHELAHALQDQHFSLRVRKRLGFSSRDAEAAWSALIEGDASAVTAELALAPSGRQFTAIPDSEAMAMLPAARGLQSPGFRAAPAVVRATLGFPYVSGLRFVAELHRRGGWKAVDAAFVRPPASSEQILHPERYLAYPDAPIAIQLPDIAAILGQEYRGVSAGSLGEFDLYLYLKQYVEDDIARIAAEGWGGSAYALYAVEPEAGTVEKASKRTEPNVFVMVTEWDSEDDAVEFYGGLIGALEARYPQQKGYSEASSQDMILWNIDPAGVRHNVLRLQGRRVSCIESLPSAQLQRVLSKLDLAMKVTDPTPEARAIEKLNLAWNRQQKRSQRGVRTAQLALPVGWTRDPAREDSLVSLAAHNHDATLELSIDRSVSSELGLDGFAHVVADRVQKLGRDVYVQTDVDWPRGEERLYQHVFTQTEGERTFAYYLGTADLGMGYAALLLRGPADAEEPDLDATFYELLGKLELLPESDAGSISTEGNGRSPR